MAEVKVFKTGLVAIMLGFETWTLRFSFCIIICLSLFAPTTLTTNPETGEVEQLDGMRYALRAHCCQQDGYLTQRISLVDAIFRVFLCNGNRPMTPRELALQIGRVGQESLILRTLPVSEFTKA